METIVRHTEVRADGRVLRGTALPYATTSESHNERFLPGSIELAETVTLNLRHNGLQAVAFHPNGGLRLNDSRDALQIDVDVPGTPAGDLALAEVRSGNLRGLSVEFHALHESRDTSGTRVIERARLSGIGLVADPSYATSVEARRRKPFIRGRVPVRARMACKCSGPTCDSVRFEKGALDQMANDRVIAVTGDYSTALASTTKGSLAVKLADDGSVEYELNDLAAATVAGAALADQSAAVELVGRLILDLERSEFTEVGGERIFTKAHVRALLLKAADEGSMDGWPELEILKRPARRRDDHRARIRRMLL